MRVLRVLLVAVVVGLLVVPLTGCLWYDNDCEFTLPAAHGGDSYEFALWPNGRPLSPILGEAPSHIGDASASSPGGPPDTLHITISPTTREVQGPKGPTQAFVVSYVLESKDGYQRPWGEESIDAQTGAIIAYTKYAGASAWPESRIVSKPMPPIFYWGLLWGQEIHDGARGVYEASNGDESWTSVSWKATTDLHAGTCSGTVQMDIVDAYGSYSMSLTSYKTKPLPALSTGQGLGIGTMDIIDFHPGDGARLPTYGNGGS